MSDPTAIEIQVNQILKDREAYCTQTGFKGMSMEAFVEAMQKSYSYLYTSSKLLFDKAVSGQLDNPVAMVRLRQLLGLMRSIHSGARTQDEGDKIFGKVMADKYITPVVNNLDKK